MKIICGKSDLQRSINISMRSVPVHTTMPILECIMIDAKNGMIRFTTNDTELGIETTIKTGHDEKTTGCEIIEPGRTAVEARLFSDIIRKITAESDSDIFMMQEGNLITITCNSSEFRIQERDPEQFP